MKTLIFAAGILASVAAGSVAEAAPLSAARPSPAITQDHASNDVTKIDYECGRGWHLSRRGDCRRNGPPPPPPRWHRPPPRWDDDRGGHRHGHRPPPPRWHRY